MVVNCFRTGGGVPYSNYPGFAKVEADISRGLRVENDGYLPILFRYDSVLEKEILPLLGESVLQKLEAGGCRLLDIGCGAGRCCNVLAKR